MLWSNLAFYTSLLAHTEAGLIRAGARHVTTIRGKKLSSHVGSLSIMTPSEITELYRENDSSDGLFDYIFTFGTLDDDGFGG